MPSPYSGGNFPGSQVFAVDGDHTVAQPIGVPRISFPFEGDSHAPSVNQVVLTEASNQSGFKYDIQYLGGGESNFNRQSFIIEQDFQVAADFFSPLYLNTLYDTVSYAPNYVGSLFLAVAVLVGESPTQEIGNGMVRWTRTYASIPWPRNSYESHTFTFPATAPASIGIPAHVLDLPGFDNQVLLGGSHEFTTDVVVRVERQYFMLNNTGAVPDTFSPDIFDPSSPFYIQRKFHVFYGTLINEVGSVFASDFKVNFENVNNTPFNTASQPSNTIPPLLTADAGNDADSGVGYVNMIAAGAEICVRESQFRPWRGNIYEKITLWSRAQ